MSWYDGDLEDNGIEEVTEIEAEFTAYDSNDWMAEDYLDTVMTLNP